MHNLTRLGAAALLIAGVMPPAGAAEKLSTYPTEAAAKAACPGDTVVWHAQHSKAFHISTSRYYGKTEHGAYACEKAAIAAGLHASKV